MVIGIQGSRGTSQGQGPGWWEGVGIDRSFKRICMAPCPWMKQKLLSTSWFGLHLTFIIAVWSWTKNLCFLGFGFFLSPLCNEDKMTIWWCWCVHLKSLSQCWAQGRKSINIILLFCFLPTFPSFHLIGFPFCLSWRVNKNISAKKVALWVLDLVKGCRWIIEKLLAPKEKQYRHLSFLW